MIRVLLVDDQELVRVGLRRILKLQDRFEVVGECEDGDEVVDAVQRHRPDVVVMDVRMRRVNGDRARPNCSTICTGHLRVLILTTFSDDETLAAALVAGAHGFILKDAPGEDILRAVEVTAAGGHWLDPKVTSQVLASYRRQRVRSHVSRAGRRP